MKRFLSLLVAALMLVTLICPCFAAEDDFVPSIGYKPSPDIVPVEGEDGSSHIGIIRDSDGNIVDYVDPGCLLVTPIGDALDKDSDILDEVREALLDLYNALLDGSNSVPYEDLGLDPSLMSVFDLFDIRFLCEEHPAMLKNGSYTLELTFDLGIGATTPVYAMIYNLETGKWEQVKLVNNGDGTVTCNFGCVGIVVFSTMKVDSGTTAPDTGDSSSLGIWIAVLAVSAAALVGVVLLLKKKTVTD